MRFANPLGLLTALLAVPLTVWYLLRSRRPRVPVGSVFLWRRTDESVTAAVPWQRFRPDAAYWLMLLAVLAGALALARPSLPVEAALGDHTIVILDASASMLAYEDGPTRLELARRQAEALVADLGPDQTVSVLEAADRARVVLSSSGDPGAVRRAIAEVRPGQGAADLVDAFTLAAALQRPGAVTVQHLYTDGEVPEDALAAAPPGLAVHGVGRARPNLAVTRFQAVPAGGGAAQVFAQVRNFAPEPAEVRLRILAGDVELDTRDLTLLPRGTSDVVAEVAVPPAESGGAAVLTARVEPVAAPDDDALAVDDSAIAVLTGANDLVVLYAGPGNVFLEAALPAVGGVELRTAPAVPGDLAGIDLLVVDRVDAPAAPTVPILAVAPTAPPDGVTLGAPVVTPAVTSVDPATELLRDVDLSSLAIAEARPIAAPALASVAGGPDGTYLAAGRLGGQPAIVLGFDLLVSNLPLDVAWPVFAANAVTWLTGPPAAVPATVGAELELSVPAGVTGVEVAPPSGDAVLLDAADARLRVDQVGVWRPRWLGPDDVLAAQPPPDPIAVNAVAEEGDLARAAPRDLPADPAAVAAGGPQQGSTPIGAAILVAVLVLLLAEAAHAGGVRPLAALRRRRAVRTARARGGRYGRQQRQKVGAGR